MTQYLESSIHRLLAEDHRIAEQGITALVRESHVLLCGEVESLERRTHIAAVIHEAFPGIRIVNDIGITRIQVPEEIEDLR